MRITPNGAIENAERDVLLYEEVFSQVPVGKVEHLFLVLNLLLLCPGPVTSLEPVDFDLFSQGLQFLLVDSQLPRG